MACVPVLCLFGRRVVWEVSLLPSQSPGLASWVKNELAKVVTGTGDCVLFCFW